MTSRIPRILLALTALVLLASLVGCGGGGGSSTGGWVIDDSLFTPNYVAALDGKLYHWNHLPMTAKFNLPDGWAATYGTVQNDAAGEWKSGIKMIRVVAGFADVTVEFVEQSELGGTTYGRTSFSYNPSSGEMLDADIRIAISDSHGPIAPIDVQALIAHELGHALGIGGHSPNKTDLMYTTHIFGVARPATALDINTAKTAYPSYFGFSMLGQETTRGGEIVTEVIE